jgi:alpha-tubulin suppressor-like RCC1 family protein
VPPCTVTTQNILVRFQCFFSEFFFLFNYLSLINLKAIFMFAMRFSITGACLALLALLAILVAPDSRAATATAVVSGGQGQCALNESGGVLCWGRNNVGQLGNATLIDSSLPVAVSGLGNGVTQLASGDSHNCALLADGGVRCWGNNANGQLGNSTNTNSNVPVTVTGLSGAVAVAAGVYHSCALMVTGGVKCWGRNTYGQLGDGTATTSTTPVNVLGLSGAVGVTVGNSHTCALINNGQIQCWGYNYYGQLGNGSNVNSTTRVTVTGISDANALVAGQSHTCAKTITGTAKCWGYNGYGQLGNGATTDVLTPVVVNGLSGITQLTTSSSSYSTCAVLTGGSAKCWGSNNTGKLGNGDTTNKTTPTTVTVLSSPVNAITIGNDTACARVNGGVQCWGANNVGQHGAGNTTATLLAQNVVGLFGSPPSQTPTPLSPVTSRFPVYTWNAIPGATSYRLRINGVTTTYTAAAANCPDGLGLCTVKSGLLTPGVYSWQVQGFDDYGDGAWSTMLQFLI